VYGAVVAACTGEPCSAAIAASVYVHADSARTNTSSEQMPEKLLSGAAWDRAWDQRTNDVKTRKREFLTGTS
jgi:hypothetical protein